MSLPDHLYQQLCERQPRRVVVAYSGGLDSHVLLHALAAIRERLPQTDITALHIHHGLNAQADHWEAHCRQVCAKLNVPLSVFRVDVPALPGPSLEDKARQARYAIFEQQLSDTHDWLLLAQHQDDQAETLLLRLLRGAGPRGLAAMPRERSLGRGRLLRPWLDVTRSELKAYARQEALQWVEDDSNRDLTIDRNYLRHRVMPALQQRWPHASAAFARSAELCRDNEELNQALAEQDLAPAYTESRGELRITELAQLSQARQANALRQWLTILKIPLPEGRRLQALLHNVLAAREDAEPLLQWAGYEARRYRDRLYVMPQLEPHDSQWCRTWDLPRPLALPTGTLRARPVCGQGLRVPEGAVITVGYRQGGERCRLPGRRGTRALKKLLQETAVPPWQRPRLPLIWIDGTLAAVADLWVCEPFCASPDESGWSLVVEQ